MKIHRFIGAFDLTQDRLRITDPDLVHQMGRVLRLQVGERVVLCDGEGEEAEGMIETIDKKTVTIQIEERRENATEPRTRVTLYLALIKRENFELALQKVTEVGVAEIVPVITERTVKPSLNLERAQTIVREAAEQSGRGRVPVVHAPISFEEACEQVKESGAEIFFFDATSSQAQSDGERDPAALRSGGGERDPSYVGMAKERSSATSRAAFIGPEGGWTPKEQSLAEAYKFATVSLGSRILRAETAAIIATYILLS